MVNDELHVVHARAAGLDVHKMEITATVRLSGAGGPPAAETRRFEALPSGLRELAGWLRGLGVSAAAMEGTGVYWEAPHDALAEAGIEVQLLHAQQVKQLRGRKTDIADSRWLARVCQFGLGQPSFVPAREFRELRVLCRHRRTLVGERSRVRNRAGKVVDRSGARVGGVISDIFGMNGRRILDGLVDRLGRDAILETLSSHVRDKVDRLGDALTAAMSDADRVVLGDLLRQHDAVERRIGALDREIAKGLAAHANRLRLLQTIPGIDAVSAAAILAETGPDPARVFGSADRLAAWAGVCPGNNESAGKRRGARARAGSSHLRGLLVACAHGAARTRTKPVPRLPRGDRRPPRPQARHRRHRAQAGTGDLRGAPRRQALPGPRGRLRGAAGQAQGAAVDRQAARVRHPRTTRRRHRDRQLGVRVAPPRRPRRRGRRRGSRPPRGAVAADGAVACRPFRHRACRGLPLRLGGLGRPGISQQKGDVLFTGRPGLGAVSQWKNTVDIYSGFE